MALALMIFGVVFGASCVWLTIRIINRRERWAKWTLATVVVLPVLYVLSFGPTCWVYSRVASEDDAEEWVTTDFIYAPLLWVWRFHDGIICRTIDWYANVGAAIEVQAATKMNASDTDPVFLTRIIMNDEPPPGWDERPDPPVNPPSPTPDAASESN
jgi:hypothetical protein